MKKRDRGVLDYIQARFPLAEKGVSSVIQHIDKIIGEIIGASDAKRPPQPLIVLPCLRGGEADDVPDRSSHKRIALRHIGEETAVRRGQCVTCSSHN